MPGARSLQGDRIKYAFLHTFFDNLSFLGMIQRICEVKHKTSRQHQELGACNNFGGATRATSFLSFSAMSMTEWIRLNCEIILSLFLNFSFETTRRFIFLVSQLKIYKKKAVHRG